MGMKWQAIVFLVMWALNIGMKIISLLVTYDVNGKQRKALIGTVIGIGFEYLLLKTGGLFD